MIRYSVFYPATDGATFDHDYYRDHHVPLAERAYGPDSVAIDRGIDGPFVAATHFTFPSVEALDAALAGEGTAAVRADIPNFTTIVAIRQVSETSG